MLCVSEEETPVVMFAALPYTGLAEKRMVPMLHAVDNMSHPAFRGTISGRQGLFATTAKHFFRIFANQQGAAFVYGFPGQRHFRLGRIMLNYASLPKGITYLEADVQRMRTGLRLFSGKCRPETAAGQEFDGLAPSLAAGYPFMILRDATFLNWRFTRHPLYSYEIWSYRSLFTSRLKGYAVFKVQGTEAVLADALLPDQGSPSVDFLRRVMLELAGRGIHRIRTWLPGGHFLTDLLQKEGWEEKTEPLGLVPAAVAQTFHSDLPYSWAGDHIFYTMADGDVV